MKNYRKILKVSFLIIAFAISLAILSACNGAGGALPSEHFDGTCIVKGFTRYYMPNGTYVDREDKDFAPHTYTDGVLISERTCTQDEITKFTCEVCNNERFVTVEKFGHDYKVIGESIASTCTEDGYTDYKCDRCSHEYRQIHEKRGHDFDETITKEPTCTEKGSKDLNCKRCGHFETADVDMLPHTSGHDIFFNSEEHWYICSVCDNAFGREKHATISHTVPPTCTAYGYTEIDCTICAYSNTEQDLSSVLGHRYEAYTCVECQRDNLLDYIDIFNSKGNSQNDLIEMEDENMFVCFYDWLIAYQITTTKFVRIAYNETLKYSEVSDFIANIRHKTTATNWSVSTISNYDMSSGKVNFLHMCAKNEGNFAFENVATITPDNYSATTYKQYNSYQFANGVSSRPQDFDNFAYKHRKNVMDVSSSDQLFFAFEHGYYPNPEIGSVAHNMMNKAKAVAKRIMDDDMSDLDKVRAIYSWLVSDVAYDYGVVALGDANKQLPFAKYSSYYLEGVFDYGIAVCDGISKAFCVLAGLEDIKCVRVISTNHAWNKVYIDVNGDGKKQWYGTDATWGNQAIRYNENEFGEYLSLDDFLFTDEQKTAKNQIGLNYVDTNSDATTEENPYKYFYFDESENATVDFVIESENELISLITHLKVNFSNFESGNKVTVQMFILTSLWSKSEIENNLPATVRQYWTVGLNAGMTISENQYEYAGVYGYSVSIIIPKA